RKDRHRFIERRRIRCTIDPLPRDLVGKHTELKPLHQAVVFLVVKRGVEMRLQRGRRHATHHGQYHAWNAHRAAPDPIERVTLPSVPRLDEELTLIFVSLGLHHTEQARQLIAQDNYTVRILAQYFTELRGRRIIDHVTATGDRRAPFGVLDKQRAQLFERFPLLRRLTVFDGLALRRLLDAPFEIAAAYAGRQVLKLALGYRAPVSVQRLLFELAQRPGDLDERGRLFC